MGENMNIANLISDVPQNELVDFLVEVSKNNESISSMIVARFAKVDNNSELSAIKTEVNEIIRENSDRYGFIDYRASYRFCKEFSSYIENIISALIAAKKTWLAFNALCLIAFKLGEPLNIDDSNGTTGELMWDVMYFWEQCISLMNDDERRKARFWFENNMYNEEIIDYIQEYLFDAYSDFFDDEDSLRAKIKFIDAFLDETNDKDAKDILSRRFDVEKYAEHRIHCMEKLNFSEEEVFAFIEKYLYLDNICNIAVQKYLDVKNYGKAEQLLENLVEVNKDFPGIVHKAKEMLLEIYKANENEVKTIQTLRWLFLNDRWFKIELYEDYKSRFSEAAWSSELESLIKEIKMPDFAEKIFIEEKMFDRLFESVKTHHKKWPSIRNLEEYRDFLQKDYAPELVRMFKECLQKDVEISSSRPQYAELADHLKHLAGIPGGKEVAVALREEWLVTYKNRRAMKEELSLVKF